MDQTKNSKTQEKNSCKNMSNNQYFNVVVVKYFVSFKHKYYKTNYNIFGFLS